MSEVPLYVPRQRSAGRPGEVAAHEEKTEHAPIYLCLVCAELARLCLACVELARLCLLRAELARSAGGPREVAAREEVCVQVYWYTSPIIKRPPPWDPPTTLRMSLWWGPRELRFLMSEVPL